MIRPDPSQCWVLSSEGRCCRPRTVRSEIKDERSRCSLYRLSIHLLPIVSEVSQSRMKHFCICGLGMWTNEDKKEPSPSDRRPPASLRMHGHVALSLDTYRHPPLPSSSTFLLPRSLDNLHARMSSTAEGNSPNRARGYKRRRDSASPSYFDQLNGQAESSTARNGNGINHESSSSAKGNGRDDGASSAWDQVDDDNYTPYVPLSKRRANLLSSLHQKSSVRNVKTKTTEEEVAEKEAIRKAEEEAEETRREKARKERTLLQEAQEVKKRQAEQG